jgi:hypothetical protein
MSPLNERSLNLQPSPTSGQRVDLCSAARNGYLQRCRAVILRAATSATGGSGHSVRAGGAPLPAGREPEVARTGPRSSGLAVERAALRPVSSAVVLRDLRREYEGSGGRGVSLEVREGRSSGLGPNGAGKTTPCR